MSNAGSESPSDTFSLVRKLSYRGPLVVYLGCTVVVAACSGGGPGLLDGGGLDADGAPDSGGAGLDDAGRDATLPNPRDGSSDARVAADANDGSVVVIDGSISPVCNDAGVYPDAAITGAAFSLDNAYGVGGATRINFSGPGSTYGEGVVRQPDGKVLLGIKVGWNRYTVGVARFLATGAIDTSFGTNGVAFIPIGTDAALAGVMLQSSGKIVIAGQSDFPGNGYTTRGWLARLDATGAVDPSFGTAGTLILDATVGAAALQADDAILVTAYRRGAAAPAVGRFTANGAFDLTFATGGWATNTGLKSTGEIIYQQADGKIMVGLHSPRAMSRLTATGALDATFGNAGAIVEVRNDAGAANAVYGFAQEPGGKVLAAGRVLDGFGVQRLTSNGSGDPTFGANGWATVPSDAGPQLGVATSAVVQADGKILAAGEVSAFDHSVTRFNSDGGIDTTYGTAGSAPVPFNVFGSLSSMAPYGTGVVLGGDQLDYSSNIWVARAAVLQSTGALSASFGDAGAATLAAGASHDEALGLALDSAGKAVVVGSVAPDRAYVAGGVARLGTTGTLDPTFAGTGKTTIVGAAVATSVVVESTGRVVVGSRSDFGSSSNDNGFMLKALLADGGSDPSFGGDGGVVNVPGMVGHAIALGPSDRIAAVGDVFARFASNSTGFIVSSFTADGHPTAGFGDAGAGNAVIVSTPASAFGGATKAGASAAVVQSDGKIVAVGFADDNLALARYTTTGALDPLFGVGGVTTTDVGASGWVQGAFRAVVQPNGAIVVAGVRVSYASGDQTNTLVLARYDTFGALDCTFGAGGVATVPLGTTEGTSYSAPMPTGLALAADGRIFVAATTSTDAIKQDVFLLRFTTAGFVDGRTVLRLSATSDVAHAIAVQSDGKVLVVGRTWTQAGLEDFFAVRLIPPP